MAFLFPSEEIQRKSMMIEVPKELEKEASRSVVVEETLYSRDIYEE